MIKTWLTKMSRAKHKSDSASISIALCPSLTHFAALWAYGKASSLKASSDCSSHLAFNLKSEIGRVRIPKELQFKEKANEKDFRIFILIVIDYSTEVGSNCDCRPRLGVGGIEEDAG